MTGTPVAAPLAVPVHQRSWFYLVIGLLIGFALGYKTYAMSLPVSGTCIRRDTSTFASGLSQQQCLRACPTCMWQQN